MKIKGGNVHNPEWYKNVKINGHQINSVQCQIQCIHKTILYMSKLFRCNFGFHEGRKSGSLLGEGNKYPLKDFQPALQLALYTAEAMQPTVSIGLPDS